MLHGSVEQLPLVHAAGNVLLDLVGQIREELPLGGLVLHVVEPRDNHDAQRHARLGAVDGFAHQVAEQGLYAPLALVGPLCDEQRLGNLSYCVDSLVGYGEELVVFMGGAPRLRALDDALVVPGARKGNHLPHGGVGGDLGGDRYQLVHLGHYEPLELPKPPRQVVLVGYGDHQRERLGALVELGAEVVDHEARGEAVAHPNG